MKRIFEIYAEEFLGGHDFKRKLITIFIDEVEAMTVLKQLNKQVDSDIYYVMKVINIK